MELLKLILPSIVILAVVYFMMREFTKHNANQIKLIEDNNKLQGQKLENELKLAGKKITIPLKFQAYERMVLFLERITPGNLLTRVLKTPMTVGKLQSLLLTTIREEYEHNMSQQLYISDKSWDYVKSAKEDVIRFVNSSASKFKSDDNSSDYAKDIIIEYGKSDDKTTLYSILVKSDQIDSVSIIGSGNVATALAINFKKAGIGITEIYSRSYKNAKTLAQKVNSSSTSSLKDISRSSDLYIIATSDDSIENIAVSLPMVNGIVAHTSGSQSVELLSGFENHGIFYPLQTITGPNSPEFNSIPICIEGSNKKVLELLHKLALRLTSVVVELNSEQRLYLHLTAVLVNNFTNYLYSMASDILEQNNIDFNLLLPLINETASKMHTTHPNISQTGPAKRNDQKTILKHIEILSEHPDYKDVYELLTNKLIKKYHE